LRRCPDAEICGITLSPDNTESRHKIPAFAITSFSLPHYTTTHFDNSRISRDGEKTESAVEILKHIKRIRLLYLIARGIHFLLKILREFLFIPFKEILHIIASHKLLKTLDILIISGGGQIDDYWGGPWGHPYSLFKWSTIASATKTKLIFLSVGVCSLDSKIGEFFVKSALKRAVYRSYRDRQSKNLLRQMSFTENDPVFPDLAFSYPLFNRLPANAQTSLESKMSRSIIGISPIAYLSSHNWPRQDKPVYVNYICQMAAFILMLLQSNCNIVFFATDGPDLQAIDDILSYMKKFSNDSDGYITRPIISNVNDLLSSISKLDYIIASRLHGILLSHLMGRPVLAVSYDRKVDTYMADMGLSDYCLDLHLADLDSLTCKFNLLRSNSKDVRIQIERRIQGCRESLQHQYDLIFSM
jgi:polysaccharide pyruvyl transferase WcaK-like protein